MRSRYLRMVFLLLTLFGFQKQAFCKKMDINLKTSRFSLYVVDYKKKEPSSESTQNFGGRLKASEHIMNLAPSQDLSMTTIFQYVPQSVKPTNSFEVKSDTFFSGLGIQYEYIGWFRGELGNSWGAYLESSQTVFDSENLSGQVEKQESTKTLSTQLSTVFNASIAYLVFDQFEVNAVISGWYRFQAKKFDSSMSLGLTYVPGRCLLRNCMANKTQKFR